MAGNMRINVRDINEMEEGPFCKRSVCLKTRRDGRGLEHSGTKNH